MLCMVYALHFAKLLCFSCDVVIFLFSFLVTRVFFLCSRSVSATDIMSLALAH